MSIRIKVSADYALFQRPELTYDKYSYEVMPPSAARGVLESIYWHPGLKWVVDKITVLNEIRLFDITPKAKQRTVALRNVAYIIEAHFIMTEKASTSDNPGKFQDIIRRRIEKKNFYSDVYLGSKEFPAQVEKVTGNIKSVHSGIRGLGFMLYDFDYSSDEKRPIFFKAYLKDGVLDFKDSKKYR